MSIEFSKALATPYFFILLFLGCGSLQAQNKSIPFQALLDSSYNCSRYDYDKCVHFVDSARQITGFNQESYYQYLSHYYEGICNHRHGHYEEALEHFNEGIQQFEVLKDTSVLSDLYYQKSLVFRQQTDYKQFLENVNTSLRLAESINYYQSIGMCNNAKLIHYNNRGRFQKAEECGLKALEIFQAIEDSSSLGDVYNNLGRLMSTQDKIDEALDYHLLQHQLNIELDNVWGKGFSHSKLASIYAKKGNYDLAKSNMKEALKITRKIGTPYELSGALRRSSKINSSLGDYETAKQDILESIQISREFEHRYSYIEGLSELVKIHKDESSLDSALVYTELLMTVKDSVLNESIGKQLSEMEVKFETEKKDKEILKLQYEDELKESRITQQRILIGGSLLALGLLAFLFFRVKSKNQKIEEQNVIINDALKEKDILLKEIHHRVKNNLQLISSLLGIQSRTLKDEKAKEAIQEGRTRVFSMSLLHQNLYQKDNLSSVPMKDYLPKLCTNLFNTYNIQGDQIKLITDIEDIKLDIETVIPLGLIVNELITNALKYAFPNEDKGQVLIQLKEKENGLLLVVQDDGIGLPQAQLDNSHDGFGLKLIGAFKSKLNADIQFVNQEGARIELLIGTYKKM